MAYYGHSPPAAIKPKMVLESIRIYWKITLEQKNNLQKIRRFQAVCVHLKSTSTVAFSPAFCGCTKSPDRSPVRTGPKPGRDPSGWLPPVTFLATCGAVAFLGWVMWRDFFNEWFSTEAYQFALLWDQEFHHPFLRGSWNLCHPRAQIMWVHKCT